MKKRFNNIEIIFVITIILLICMTTTCFGIDFISGEAVRKFEKTKSSYSESRLEQEAPMKLRQAIINIPMEIPPEEEYYLTDVYSKPLPKDKELYKEKEVKYHGYIVQFKEEPLLAKKNKLEKVAEANKLKFEKKKLYDPTKYILEPFALMPENIPTELADHEIRLINEREKILGKIKQKVPRITGQAVASPFKNFLLRITGHAVVEPKILEKNILGDYKNSFNGIALDITDEEAKEIKKLKEVKEVYPNYEVYPVLMDSVPLINADKVWDLEDSSGIKLTGKGITIAVIDTGIDYTHPDLGGCLGSGCKVVGGYDFINEDDDPMDDQGHGTHCAAIAAGNGVLKGVAPDAKLYAYKVLSSGGSGTMDGVIKGIERAVDPNQDSDFSDHADIISMSLGCSSGNPDDPTSQAVDNAVDSGVVAVIAAGNSGPREQTIGSPGTARKAITVGATYKKDYTGEYGQDTNPKIDQVTYFSSRGPESWDRNMDKGSIAKPDIVAPGAIICAAQWDDAFESAIGQSPLVEDCLDNDHIAISGTSMATPIVAGSSALLLQKNPDWNPDEIKYALRTTAKDLGYDVNAQGYGRIDILNAIQLENPPAVVYLQTSGKVSGIIDIEATILSDNFNDYSLYYGDGYNPSTYELISTGNTLPSDNILLNDFDTSYLSEGIKRLKLVVHNTDGQITEDNTFIKVNNVNLESPGVPYYNHVPFAPCCYPTLEEFIENMYIQKDSVDIIGTVGDGTGIVDYEIEWSNEDDQNQWSSVNIILTHKKGQSVVLAKWNNLNELKEGNYLLRISITYEYGQTLEAETRMVLTIPKDLHKGWPKPFIGTHLTLDGEELVIATMGKNVHTPDETSELTIRDSKGNLLSGWPQPTSYSSWFFPSVGDINNNKKNEVVIASGRGYRQNSKIFAFNENGKSISGWPVSLSKYTPTQTVLSDLDNDDKMEIIVNSYFDDFTCMSCVPNDPICITGTPNGRLYIYHSDGTPVSGWPKTFERHHSWLPPAVGDINADGKKEIVTGVFSADDFCNDLERATLYVFKLDGTDVEGWPKSIKEIDPNFEFTEGDRMWGLIYSSPVLTDLDNNGDLEIIFIINNGIYAFHHDGSKVKGWPQKVDLTLSSPIAIGEIDKSYPGPEIVIGSAKGYKDSPSRGTKLYVYHSDGTPVSGWPKIVCWDERAGFNTYSPSPIIADIDNDGNNDIISSCAVSVFTINKIFAFDNRGNILEGWPKMVLPGSHFDVSGFSLGDANGDGILDLGIGDNRYYEGYSIYLWDLKRNYDKDSIEWGTAYHNSQHTGCYKCDKAIPVETRIVIGECGEPCPQECIDHNAECIEEISEECNVAFGACFNACTSGGRDVAYCNAMCVPQKKRFTCSYETTEACFDSDGEDEFRKGYVNYNSVTQKDYCTTGRRERKGSETAYDYKSSCVGDNCKVAEFYCDVNGVNALKLISCQYGCEDGACISELKSYCTDSDYGKDYYKKGRVVFLEQGSKYKETYEDECQRDLFLVEYYCDENDVAQSETYRCPNGCDSGICLQKTCTDECEVKDEKKCVSSYTLKKCGNYDYDECLEWSSEISCIGGMKCVNGECIPTECLETWECTEWSECVEGKQTRTCTDKNKCGTDRNKPLEVRDCSELGPDEYFLKVDYSVTISDKLVTLLNVGSGGSVVVSVDEVVENIPATATETVNGLNVTNIRTYYEDTKSERAAVLKIV